MLNIFSVHNVTKKCILYSKSLHHNAYSYHIAQAESIKEVFNWLIYTDWSGFVIQEALALTPPAQDVSEFEEVLRYIEEEEEI